MTAPALDAGQPAGTASTTTITESSTRVLEAPRPGGGEALIQLITPGWGSSGYYSSEVLESAGRAKVFPAGTQMYADHPTASENDDRPERSVRDLAAVLTEDARWNGEALVAPARLFSVGRELAEKKDAIGVSIRATASAVNGEAEGRRGLVVTQLHEGISVDFVTRAGRGGKVLKVWESARRTVREARNVGQWLESRLHLTFTTFADDMFGSGRLTRDERIALSSAIGDGLAAFTTKVEATAPQLYKRDLWEDPDEPAETTDASEAATFNDVRDGLLRALKDTYGGERVWLWVRDFDDSQVWYERESPDSCDTYQLGYTIDDDNAVTLTGEPVEVRPETRYVPVPATGQASESVPGRPAEREGGTGMSGTTQGAAPNAPSTTTTPTTGPEDANAQLTEARSEIGRLQLQIAQLGDNATELTEAKGQLAEAKREIARLKANDAARKTAIETLGKSTLPEVAHAEVIEAVTGANVPLTEAGELDGEKLTANLKAAIEKERLYLAKFAESQGMGQIKGLGTSSDGELSEAAFEQGMAKVFAELGMDEKTAKLAAEGR